MPDTTISDGVLSEVYHSKSSQEDSVNDDLEVSVGRIELLLGLRNEMVISVEEAGVALGMKRSAAYAAVRRGEIPVIRLGRRIKVPVIGLAQVLASRDPKAS
jgi:excisionase family DNA binding protein